MTKKYEREEKELDRLQRENRDLKGENRTLRRRLKQLNKGYRKLEEDEILTEDNTPEEIKKLCFECSGEYKEIIIANRRFRKCQDCGKTGKVTILNEKN